MPSLCGVLLTVTAAGVDATVRLAVDGDDKDGTAVRSSVQLPLSVGPPGGFVVLQASVPRAFDELARDATLVLPDGGLGVVLDRHLSRTTADQSAGDALGAGPSAPAADLSAAVSDASLVNQALGALLGQGYLAVDAATELDRRARATGASRVAVAAQVLQALIGCRSEDAGDRRSAAARRAAGDPCAGPNS